MKPITKKIPITLLVLLCGSAALFYFSAFLVAAYLLAIAGLLLSLFSFFHAVAILMNAEVRRRTNLTVPIFTALIAIVAWSAVVCEGIRVKQAFDKRIQQEQAHPDT